MVKLLKKDFKEGNLEKMSHSFLTRWKPKYCRVGNNQFIFYKNISTGWISGTIDFRRLHAKLQINKESNLFL